jgi:hypothetical protein
VIGDLDANGFDEVVLTLPDGRLLIYSRSFEGRSGVSALNVVTLSAGASSAAALGDADDNGSLEIALWNATHFYLFANSGRVLTNWPKTIEPASFKTRPPLSFENPLNGPLIGDINGDGSAEIVFPTLEGTVHAFSSQGQEVATFPRKAPTGFGATPTIADLDGSGALRMIGLGLVPSLSAVDPVADTVVVDDVMVLSIQTLPGSDSQNTPFWSMYQNDPARRGRVTASNPLVQKSQVAETNSFIIYPNPVRENGVHARIVLNRSGTVRVEIYNIEGERTVAEEFVANPGNVVQTPFDEIINVAKLKSGVYVMRLIVKSSSGSDSFAKTFAIAR